MTNINSNKIVGSFNQKNLVNHRSASLDIRHDPNDLITLDSEEFNFTKRKNSLTPLQQKSDQSSRQLVGGDY